jgi:hypothetical protein
MASGRGRLYSDRRQGKMGSAVSKSCTGGIELLNISQLFRVSCGADGFDEEDLREFDGEWDPGPGRGVRDGIRLGRVRLGFQMNCRS